MKKLILMLTVFLTACGGSGGGGNDGGNHVESVFDMWALEPGILNFRGLVKDINFPYVFYTDGNHCMCDILFMGYDNRGNIIVSSCRDDARHLGYTDNNIAEICRKEFDGMMSYDVQGGILTLIDSATGFEAKLNKF